MHSLVKDAALYTGSTLREHAPAAELHAKGAGATCLTIFLFLTRGTRLHYDAGNQSL